MTLTKWIKQSGMNQSDLASRLGVTRQAVQVWASGRSPPSLYHALAIEALTGGAVRADGWLPRTKQLALQALRGESSPVAHGAEDVGLVQVLSATPPPLPGMSDEARADFAAIMGCLDDAMKAAATPAPETPASESVDEVLYSS